MLLSAMRFLILVFVFISCSGNFRPQSWGIQLQGYNAPYDLKRIRDAKTDLWVMDFSDGPDHFFSKAEIDALKANNKKIISYMSIGEIETYRFYYSHVKKELKGPINPNWKDNITAKFWEKDWQKFFLEKSPTYGASYLDRIISSGYDGVFLDIIDAFERFPDKQNKANLMAEFVIRISKEAKAKNKNFLIILQNGLHMRRFLKDPKDLLAAIDGVNVESAFFIGPKVEDNNFSENLFTLDDVKFYQKADKFVLSLEYLKDPKLLSQYFEFAKKNGLIPVSGQKKLSGPLIFP